MALSDLQPTRLQCEYTVNPLGVETPSPRLNWALTASKRGQRQTAYQILVASSEVMLAAGHGDMWDSGKVESDRCVHVEYAGGALHSGQRCYWKVRVWDVNGMVTPYTEAAWWEMGLLKRYDWKAQWITPEHAELAEADQVKPSPIFRREFSLNKPIASARAYICGLGYYELRLNGRKVGDHVLDPAFTHYDKRALYVTYDITEHLTRGENAVGVLLGNGWYNCHTKNIWKFEAAAWREYPRLTLQIMVVYTDGSSEMITTDRSWRATEGPIVFDGLRNGEFYDARREMSGWDTVGFDDTAWSPVKLTPGAGGRLVSQTMPPIRVVESRKPVAVDEVAPGVFVFDTGQNLTGWAQLRVSGPAGTDITLRYAEKRKEDGHIDQSNINTFIYSGACQEDRYVLKGEGTEVWEPRFTYHGFQYVEVTGFPGTPTLDALCIQVVHTDLASAGSFTCSNELFNKIQQCALWSYRGNFVGYPTDCPHREKNGWTGDAQLAAEMGLFNFDATTAYEKWLADFPEEQRENGMLPGIIPTPGWGYDWGNGPAWDSAYVLIPWYLYLYSGDTRILATHYPGMKRYLDFLATLADRHIISYGLGDWCAPESSTEKTPSEVLLTAYYYVDTLIVAEIARMLGKEEDLTIYAGLAKEIREAFRDAFYQPSTGKVATGTQTAQACALYQGLVTTADQEKVLQQLIEQIAAHDDHLDFGILGAKYVLNALSDLGRTDIAYAIANQTTYPSWGHWIERGATTLWEDWQGMNSLNHIMFGDISAWFYKYLAGINPDPAQPGFKHIIIKPNPVADLDWVRGEHQSMYGRISSHWRRTDGQFVLDVLIPANCTATVYIPATAADAVTEGNTSASTAVGVSLMRQEEGYAVFSVQSGSYHFTAQQ